MTEKLFTFFFALVASMSAIYASDIEVDGIWYDFDSSTKTATVTYHGSSYYAYSDEYSGIVVIPSSVTYYGITYSVTSIGKYAFRGCSSLTSMTIPNSVTNIEYSAFYDCSSLTSVTIPNSVTSIGYEAFYSCSSLTSVTIPNSVTSIEYWAFAGCSKLSSINVDTNNPNYCSMDGVLFDKDKTTLIQYPIGNTRSEYIIPNSVTIIGEYAFDGCSSLTSITIPNSVTSIGEYAFQGCSSLTSVTIPNSVTRIRTFVFSNCRSLTSVTIPNSVTIIGSSAFYNCSSLTSVTIPNSVTSIGKCAFYYCSSLTSVTIPNSVTSIGVSAFYNCSSLTSVTIGESVTSIGDAAFYNCSSLTSVTIPESVTSIGDEAFRGCSSLTTITCEAATPPTIGDTYTFGNTYTFDGVSESIPVYVPCGCVEAYKAANGWKDFTNIQEPLAEYSLTVDVNDAIMGSAKVDKNTICDAAHISATPNFGYHFVQWSDGNTENPRTLVLTQDTILIAEFAQSFSGQCGDSLYWEFADSTLHITGSGKMYEYNSYDNFVPWRLLVTSIKFVTIGESVTSIGNYAFYGCDSLTSVTIPNGVTRIGEYAFYDCSSLTSVTIPNGVPSIGVNAFSHCFSLTSVTINSDAIVNKAYTYNSNISRIFGSQVTEYIIGEHVEKIGNYAFYNCSSLTSVTIGESVTSIGNSAFYSCSSLTSVTINSDAIVNKQYSTNSNLSHIFGSQVTEYVIGDNVIGIGDFAFYRCSALTSLTIGNGVTSIGNYAFEDCSSLTSINVNANNANYCSIDGVLFSKDKTTLIKYPIGNTRSEYIIPNSVTSIEYGAFSGCSSLTSITIPNSVTSIGDYAFYDCSSLTSITIPNSVTSIGWYAFSGCSKLTSITCEAETPPTVGQYAFDGVSKSIPVYVPCECVKAYKAASGWKAFTNIQESLAEYSIEVYVNDTRMGTAKVDYNTFCEGNQISATPNIGYHFVQWSDGNTENHRTLELTQDTILTAEFAQSFSGQCGDSLYWELVDTTLHITGKGEMYNYDYNTIPWKLLERSIKVLTIAEDVTKLSRSFVICSVLESVVWNARHAADAYSDGQYVYPIFYEIRSQIKSFTFGEDVEYIPTYLCSGCSKLTSVTIPNSVTSIGSAAFEDCSSLTSVHITDLAAWCNIDFVDFRANPLYIAHNLYLNGELVKDLVIPNGVTSIGNYAFDGCWSFTSVTIPNSVTSIGNSAFYSCTSLKSITCEAENPPTVGSDAFYNVPKSIPVYVPCGCVGAYKARRGWADFTNIQEPLAEYSIEVYVNDTIMGSAKVDINNACGAQISATPNYGYHFVQWSDRNTDNPRTLGLTQDTILIAEFAPNTYTITTVSSDTQRGTTQGDTTVNYLEYITISASASYGYHFVQWNDGNSDNPRQVQVTGNTTYTATFAKNTYAISLSCNEEQGSVEGVTSAEYLDTVTISATPNLGYHFVQWSDGNTENPRTLELTQDTILIAEFAQSFSGQCGDSLYWELVDTTLHITGKGEMYNYESNTAPWKLLVSSIKSLSLSERTTSIGNRAFRDCSSLTSVTISESVTSIGSSAFYNCSSLTSITIPTSVTSIGDDAFRGCSSLTSVTIPNSVTSIGYYAFSFCESLTSVTIGNSVKSIGYYAFSVCDNITSVTWNAKNCNTYNFGSQVTSFEFGNEVEVVPSSLCEGMEKLTSVTIPNSVKNIGTSAFEGCARLGKISLGTGLEEIAANAFASCTRLYDIYCHAVYPPFVDESSFANYNAYLYIPCDSKRDYTLDPVWGKFQHIECLSNEETDVENVDTSSQQQTNCQKIIRNGQLLILRDGVEYTVMGQEL